MLSNSLSSFGISLVIETWSKQTLCVSYFNKIYSISFVIWAVKKCRHYELANSLSMFRVHLVIEKLFKQTLCVRYFSMIHCGHFIIWPVNKADTMCYLNHWVHLGYIFWLKSDLIRQSMIAILLRCIQFISWFNQWINQTYCVS